MSISEEQSTNNLEVPKQSTDKNYNLKLKFAALKNGLIEEKNKNKHIQIENENLQKEIEELKKINTELTTKIKEYEEENQKIKEENILKQELINKLRDELQKYREKGSKTFSKFFSSLLESDNFENVEEKDQKELKIESLEQENISLSQQLSEVKNTLYSNDKKLTECIKEYNIYKEKSKNEFDIMENKYKKTIEDMRNENTKNETNLKLKLDEAEKNIVKYLKTIRDKEIIIQSIETVRGDRDKDVMEMKEKVRKAEETLIENNDEMKEIKMQNELMNKKIKNYNQENEDLKLQIQQYKLIIDDLTPFNIDYVFKGKIVNQNNGNNNNNLDVSFGKYQHSVYMKIGDQELILFDKQITDVLGNVYIPGQLKFILSLNDGKNDNEIIGQFTKKEGEYIQKFFIDFKNKSSHKDEELMNMSLNNYYY